MRRVALPALLAAGALGLGLACSGGQSGAEGPPGDPGEPGGPSRPGGDECEEDFECRDNVGAALEALAQPAPRTVAFSGSRCEAMGVQLEFESVQGFACACDTGGGGQILVGPVGAGCYVRGRAGQCILGDGDYAACDPGDPSACSAVCDDAALRIEADSNRTIETELLFAECSESNCRSVVSLDGRCYANHDYLSGRAQDCALGVEGILAASAIANAPPMLTPGSEERQFYRNGTSATLNVTVSREWFGTELAYQSFGATAQFFTTIEGVGSQLVDEIDPVEGIDDCGVSRRGGTETSPAVEFLDVDSAVLLDGATELAFEEFAPGFDFYSYNIDLTAVGATPRHGGSYGFVASGGGFGASVELTDIVLPESLSIPELERQSRFDRDGLDLTWTGRGSAPLRLGMRVVTSPDESSSYVISCRLTDDGYFHVPREVLDAVPEGDLVAGFTRENRLVHSSGGKSVQTIASVGVTHRFALGPACDGSASMAACQASALQVIAAYEACGAEVPPLATLCPDYLSESCHTCPEYYECVGRTAVCDENGLSAGGFGCVCP